MDMRLILTLISIYKFQLTHDRRLFSRSVVFVRHVDVHSFVRELLAHFLRRVVIWFVAISNVCATIDNVLAAFIAPCDGCIDIPLVCGNRECK